LEKNLTIIDASHGQLTVDLSNNELQPYYEKTYRDAQRNIDLKGFRKGKVPINLIKKMFGKQLDADSIEEAISESLKKIFSEDKIKAVGQPKVTKLDHKDDGITFTLEFDKIPDFELKDYRGISIGEPVHRVTDEEVEEEIARILLNNGTLHLVEQVSDENHIVQVTLEEIDKSTGEVDKSQKAQETSVFLGSETVLPELKTSLINLKAGDSFNFNPAAQEVGAPDKTFKVTVKEIQQIVPVEFTNEFVKNYTSNKFVSTEEFREETGFQLQEKWDNKSRQKMEDQLVDSIVQMHDFEPPETLVNTALQSFVDNIKEQYKGQPNAEQFTVESFGEGLRPLAIRTVKWDLIQEKIIEKEGLEVEDTDIESLIEYNLQNIKGDRETIRKSLMSNHNITGRVLAKKVMDFLMDFAITQETDFDGNPLEEED